MRHPLPSRRLLSRLLLALACAASAAQAQPAPTPWLEYKQSGGLTPYGPITMTITKEGAARVQTSTTDGPIDYTTQLSSGELAWFRLAAAGVDFANAQDRRLAPTDLPDTTITLREDGRVRTATFAVAPSITDLRQGLQKLLAQAIASSQLSRGQPYNVNVGVNPLLAGSKILQPRVFIDPLRAYLLKERTGADTAALEALAYITTPEDFAGTVMQFVDVAEGKDRRILYNLVSLHPFYANIPKDHLRAYFPLLQAERTRLRESTESLDSLIVHRIDSIESYLQKP
jgi:hypothetical protein